MPSVYDEPSYVILISSSSGLTFTVLCEKITSDWGLANCDPASISHSKLDKNQGDQIIQSYWSQNPKEAD